MNFAPPVRQPDEEAYVIRRAVRREFAEITDLVVAAISAYRGTAPEHALQLYIERSADTAARADRGDLLVVTQHGRVLGTVTFHADAREAGFPAGWASFGTLAVHPQAQRRGVASLLVRQCVKHALPAADTIGIHTGAFMQGARRLYEGMGFVRAPGHDLRASDFIAMPSGSDDVHILGYRLDLDDALSG